jgi:transcription initiation factor IIE alpha subunit
MLEFKTIRQLKADKEFLGFIGKRPPDIKTTDGAILEIKKTNIKTIKPIIYEISDLNLIIYHYACDNLNNKRYYIPSHKKSYTLNQIKEMIRNMLTTNLDK